MLHSINIFQNRNFNKHSNPLQHNYILLMLVCAYLQDVFEQYVAAYCEWSLMECHISGNHPNSQPDHLETLLDRRKHDNTVVHRSLHWNLLDILGHSVYPKDGALSSLAFLSMGMMELMYNL